MKIKVLKAEYGDSILIEFKGDDEKNHHILVDGGTTRTYNMTLKDQIEKDIINKHESIDIAVITHTDDDHICGIKELVEDMKASTFSRDLIKRYWFNFDEIIKKFFADSSNNKISIEDGTNLKKLLKDIGKWEDCECIATTQQYVVFGAKILILSPTNKTLKQFDNYSDKEKESGRIAGQNLSDYEKTLDELCTELQTKKENTTLSLSNRSSIAFIFEDMGKKALLLGDAHPAIVVESLKELGYSQENKLVVDCVKIAHHGSIKNTSFELLAMIDCQQFLISTNGTQDNLPNKKTFAKILCHPQRDLSKKIYFLFNYEEEKFKRMFTEADKKKYNFECHFENTPYGYLVEL